MLIKDKIDAITESIVKHNTTYNDKMDYSKSPEAIVDYILANLAEDDELYKEFLDTKKGLSMLTTNERASQIGYKLLLKYLDKRIQTVKDNSLDTLNEPIKTHIVNMVDTNYKTLNISVDNEAKEQHLINITNRYSGVEDNVIVKQLFIKLSSAINTLIVKLGAADTAITDINADISNLHSSLSAITAIIDTAMDSENVDASLLALTNSKPVNYKDVVTTEDHSDLATILDSYAIEDSGVSENDNLIDVIKHAINRLNILTDTYIGLSNINVDIISNDNIYTLLAVKIKAYDEAISVSGEVQAKLIQTIIKDLLSYVEEEHDYILKNVMLKVNTIEEQVNVYKTIYSEVSTIVEKYNTVFE